MFPREAEPMPWRSPGPSLQKVCWWWLPLFVPHTALESEQERSSRAFVIPTCLVMSLPHTCACTHPYTRTCSPTCVHTLHSHTHPYSLHTHAVPHAHTHTPTHACTPVHTLTHMHTCTHRSAVPFCHQGGRDPWAFCWWRHDLLCLAPGADEVVRLPSHAPLSGLCLMCVRQTFPTHFSQRPPFPCPQGCAVGCNTDSGVLVCAGKAPSCWLCCTCTRAPEYSWSGLLGFASRVLPSSGSFLRAQSRQTLHPAPLPAHISAKLTICRCVREVFSVVPFYRGAH